MHPLRYTLAIMALGISFHAAAAPREITFSAELANLTKDGKPVSSVKLGSGPTYSNGSVVAGKISYDLQGPGNQVWHNGDSPEPVYWWADSMHVRGEYAVELGDFGTVGTWQHSPYYYDAQINIDSRADGVFVRLNNVGMKNLSLTFQGAAHSLDNATYFNEVLDRIFFGTGFTLTQAKYDAEYYRETEYGHVQFDWGADLVIDEFNGVSPVPEPSTWAMAATGLFLIGAVARRRKASETKRLAA
ncbi:PEP-CTERM sorting domain-containing protein [Pseudoduganella sp. SL102]|uniref:PEP-CTERM sorting domain-containing protein n=1 Tax=Pseudoduganella sp. SL102 TaxID=2995154 RepID=UPI00248C12DE|nr:PEP-CTERM sorting domain-containing protein [Pseudoduganella sp. SL102]WBS03885.1 PEP-CTERM sorting domain-containing protein [Pseudoduganella sp. SL102]